MQSSWHAGQFFASYLGSGKIEEYMRQRVKACVANSGLLTCEGECSKTEIHNTRHAMVAEVYDTKEEAYRQVYRCTCCGTDRNFGLTYNRLTLMGPLN